MPSASAFRSGLRLTRDELAIKLKSDFKLTKQPEIGHVVVTTNRLYHFPMKFTFETQHKIVKNDVNKLVEQLKSNLCRESKIILSEYGSPYECSIDEESFKIGKDNEEDDQDGHYVVHIDANGVGTRRMDIPTEAQKNRAKEQSENPDPDLLKKRIQGAKDLGYRIVRSRFSTGTCASCQGPIQIAEHICKNEKSGSPGWSHLDCVLGGQSAEEPKKVEKTALESPQTKRVKSDEEKVVLREN